MKYLILFLLIPLTGATQRVNEFWITPVANVEFDGEKIIYSYSMDECITFENIHPVHYNSGLLELRGVIGTGCISDYKDMYNQLGYYLLTWQYGQAFNRDKLIYLKALTLLIIWDITRKKLIPDNSLEIVGYLENDLSPKISQAAKSVKKLYYEYNEK